MTKAQRNAVERLKKKHRCAVVVTQESFLPGEVRVQLLTDQLPEDERERVISPSGIVQEPVG